MSAPKLRYDGKYDFLPAPLDRQWTLLTHFVDAAGADRFKGSFSLEGLAEIGVVPTEILGRRNSNGGNNK